MIKAILFDFGNVIAYFDHRRASRRLAAYTDLPEAEVYARLFTGALHHDYESGRMTTEEFMRRAAAECLLSCPECDFAPGYADMFWPNPEVCELIPRLKPAYRLVLVSNTNDLHVRQFRGQFRDVLGHFDALVLSHEVGARKPSPEIYEAAREAARCEPAEGVFIDDLPANVAAAVELGWHGIVYTGGDDLRPRLAALGVAVS
jgi:putative hydrolase of the HAD superfamily